MVNTKKSDAELEDWYQRFMALNQETFEARQFGVAYHALAAACHCAQTLQNEAFLAEIASRATQQLAWIDENVPNYEHSSGSARARRHTSIFAMPAKQAQVWSHIRMHEHKTALEQVKTHGFQKKSS